MTLALVPDADDRVVDAVQLAADTVDRLDERTARLYTSAWRRAGLAEGVSRGRGSTYAPSPRSSRGATRA